MRPDFFFLPGLRVCGVRRVQDGVELGPETFSLPGGFFLHL